MSREINKENVRVDEKKDPFVDLATERSMFEQYRRINIDIGKVVAAITTLTLDTYSFDLEKFFDLHRSVFSLFGINDQLHLRNILLNGMKNKLRQLENELSELKKTRENERS